MHLKKEKDKVLYRNSNENNDIEEQVADIDNHNLEVDLPQSE